MIFDIGERNRATDMELTTQDPTMGDKTACGCT